MSLWTVPAPPSFTYDSLGRLVSASNPESGTISYAYDWANNLTSNTDARGETTTYTYDALNLLTVKSYSDGTPSVTYTYGTAGTSTGHLIALHNGNSTNNFTNFDVVGNVLASNQVTAGQTYSFAYSYNLAGALTSETYPSGRVVTTARDGADRPYALSGALSGQTTNYITQTSYWPSGGVYFFIRGNNVWHAASFNNRLQQTESYEAVNNNNSVGSMLLVSCPNWGVNDNHNLYDICPHASATNDNRTLQSYTAYIGGPGYSQYLGFSQSFGHDSLNRLTSASDSGGWSRSFGYDIWGNMWVTGASGVALPGNTPTSDVYNGANRINGATYDASGNDLSVNGDTLTYNAENRVASAYDNVTHNTESYLYDGDGQRVEKTGPAGAIVYVYDAFGQLASEYSTVPVNPPCTTCYLSYDHLGSVRLVTDQNGNVVARHGFLPFGEEIPANTAGRNGQWGSTTDVEQKFTGQILDTETGMDYFNARYFDAPLGRFNSPDPANAGADMTDPQTWNAYAYVRNNPLALTDPGGMGSIACDLNNLVRGCTPPDPDTDPYAYQKYVEAAIPWSNEDDPALASPDPFQLMTLNLSTPIGYRSTAPENGSLVPVYSTGVLSLTGGTRWTSPSEGSQPPNEQIAANINDLIVFAAHGKGERNYTAKPDKPLKGVRPVVKGGKVVGWTIPSPDGKRIPKSLDWGKANGLNGNDPKWLAVGMLAGAGATAAADALVGLEGWELLLGAGALVF